MANVKVESAMDKQKRLFREFVQNKRIMVVDSQSFSRAALARTLMDLGASMSQITLESTYSSALASISQNCPDILFSEFDLENGTCGLDLLVTQRKINKQSKKSLFILVTSNTSQAAVARAAEEDVDGYLLKPYTMDGLRMAIMKYAVEKAYPSAYIIKIGEGKEKLEQNSVDEALQIFTEATALDPKPALAHFYHGLGEESRLTLSNAENDYNEGLSYNKIHYKCMVGLFELFMHQKRNKEAYDVVRQISKYFPSNPDRLATVLRLAVINEAYEDIERYYQLFTKLDARNDMLIRYVCAALIVCGKYYLQNKENVRAVELFNKAKATSARNPRLLKEIVLSLLSYGLVFEASEFLKAFPAESHVSPEYVSLSYAIEERTLPEGESIAKGRELLTRGVQEYILYFILIQRSAQVGFKDHAEQLLKTAIGLWPDKQEELMAQMGVTPKKGK